MFTSFSGCFVNRQKEFFVPGRLCLFGEHSDWAGGYRAIDHSIAVGHCLAAGTNQGIHAIACGHPDRLIIKSMKWNSPIKGKS